MPKFNSILAIGAHTDDIEYSCFGFLLKQHSMGSKISVFVASPDSRGSGDQYYERVEETKQSFAGMSNINLIFRNTNKILPDNYEKMSDQIREIIINNDIDLVLIHDNQDDTHQEHRLIHEISMSATRRLPINIFAFKSPSAHNGFKSNYVVDITDQYPAKIEAVKKHITQSGLPYMSEDSLEIFNKSWSGKVLGINYCEEFRIIRMVG